MPVLALSWLAFMAIKLLFLGLYFYLDALIYQT
jgi:hypothetical protein